VKKRVDANQPELVTVMRKLGCSWRSTHEIPGALDGIIGVAGIDQRIEIKDGSKPPSARKLTPAEQDEFDMWRGRPPRIIESIGQLIELVDELRRESKS
jgi:hypothetical protein